MQTTRRHLESERLAKAQGEACGCGRAAREDTSVTSPVQYLVPIYTCIRGVRQTSVTARSLDLSPGPAPTPTLAPEPSSSEESLPCELYDKRSRSAELERYGTGRATYYVRCPQQSLAFSVCTVANGQIVLHTTAPLCATFLCAQCPSHPVNHVCTSPTPCKPLCCNLYNTLDSE